MKNFLDEHKIAVDRDGVVGWIRDPENAKKYRAAKNLAIKF